MACTCREFVFPFVTRLQCDEYYCLICDAHIHGQWNLNHHVITVHHSAAAQSGKFISPRKIDEYYCKPCDSVIGRPLDVHIHLQSELHRSSSSQESKKIDSERETISWNACERYPAPFVAILSENHSYCLLCDEFFYRCDARENHIVGGRHAKAVESNGSDILPLEHDRYYCICCDETIRDYRKVYSHMVGSKHRSIVLEVDTQGKDALGRMFVHSPVSLQAHYPPLTNFHSGHPLMRLQHPTIGPQYPMMRSQHPTIGLQYRMMKPQYPIMNCNGYGLPPVPFFESPAGVGYPHANFAPNVSANVFLRSPLQDKCVIPTALKRTEITNDADKCFQSSSTDEKLSETTENHNPAAIENGAETRPERQANPGSLKPSENRLGTSDQRRSSSDNTEKTPPRLADTSWRLDVTSWQLNASAKILKPPANSGPRKNAEHISNARNNQEVSKDGAEKRRFSPDNPGKTPRRNKTPPRLDVTSWQWNACAKIAVTTTDSKPLKRSERLLETWNNRDDSKSQKRNHRSSPDNVGRKQRSSPDNVGRKQRSSPDNEENNQRSSPNNEERKQRSSPDNGEKAKTSARLDVTSQHLKACAKIFENSADSAPPKTQQTPKECDYTRDEDINDQNFSSDDRKNICGRTKASPRSDDASWEPFSCKNSSHIPFDESKAVLERNLPNMQRTKSTSSYANTEDFTQKQLKQNGQQSAVNQSIDQRSSEKIQCVSEETGSRKIERNFDLKGDIYDMHDRVREIKRSIDLCFVSDTNEIYCLVCRRSVGNKLAIYFEHLCNLDHCDHLESMMRDFAGADLHRSQFTKTYRAYQYIEEIPDDAGRCLVCEKDLRNENCAFENHVDDPEHRENCEKMRTKVRLMFASIVTRMQCDWYKVHKYCCSPCSVTFGDDNPFVEHLQSEEHERTIGKLGIDKQRLGFNFCESCALLWYGQRSTYFEHYDGRLHNQLLRDGYRVLSPLPDAVKFLLAEPERYVERTVKYLDHKTSLDRRNRLIDDLGKALKFPNPKAFLIGSRIPDSRLPDGDIDISLTCGGTMHSKDEISKYLVCIDECLRENRGIWEVKNLKGNDLLPVIKAHHRETELTCKISFEIGLLANGVEFIDFLTCVFGSYRELILFLKQWLTYCGLSSAGFITSYALYWCVIFYLQNESLLPSINELIAIMDESVITNGHQAVLEDLIFEKAACHKFNWIELLGRFFEFYANFDFRDKFACPLLGKAVRKKTLLQPCAEHSHLSVSFTNKSAMWIQDPSDLQLNITEGVSKACLSRFRVCCSESLHILRSTVA